MSLGIKLALIGAFILTFVLPLMYFYNGKKTVSRSKKSLVANMVSFFSLVVIAAIMLFVTTPVQAAAGEAAGMATGLGYLGAALATGLSCVGGGIAVASAASAALGAISEDPSALGKSLIFVGLAEGVCLYGLIISFMIIGQL